MALKDRLDKKYVDFLKYGIPMDEQTSTLRGEDKVQYPTQDDLMSSVEPQRKEVSSEPFDMEKSIPSAKDTLPPLTPQQLKGRELSPFEESPLGQWWNKEDPNEDKRTNVEKAQDFVNAQREDWGPNPDFDRTPLATKEKAKSLQRVEMGQIPEENYKNLLGDDLYKLTSPNASVQVPLRPEELASLSSQQLAGLPKSLPSTQIKSVSKTSQSVSDNALKESPNEISKVSSQDDSFDRQLEAAREQDRQHGLLFGLLKASQMGGAAIAGTKADTTFADTQLSKENQFVNRLKTDMELKEESEKLKDAKAMRDPNSDISKQARAMLGMVYPDLLAKNPNISAAQLEKAGLNLGGLATARENAESRKLQAKMHAETMAVARANKMDERESKRLEEYRKARDPMNASIRSNIGKEVNRYTQSTHALNLVHGLTDLNKATPMQKRELAVALATMVSPGLPHEATIAKLDDSTLNDEIAHRLQQITGSPAATNTKGLTQQLVDSVKNQRSVAGKFIADYQRGIDSSFAKDIARNPEAFNQIAKFQQFDVEEQPKSTTIHKGNVVPLTGQGIPGRTFTHEGKNYKVNPDGKSATEI